MHMHPIVAQRLLMVVVLALGLLGTVAPGSDFFQDYGAVRAWREGLDPNTRTHLLAERYAVDDAVITSLQVAHPPAAVLIALPFSYLPWPVARIAWLVASWALLALAIDRVRPRLVDVAVCVPMMAFGLSIGALDPLMIALLLVAAQQQYRSYRLLALALGTAIALKVYPALFLAGLWLTGQRRAALLAGAVGTGLSVVAGLILGVEATMGWLAFMPVNTAWFADHPVNLSLSRYVRLLSPEVSPLLSAVIIGFLLMFALRLRRGHDAFGRLAPVLVLTSPLSWVQYLPVVLLSTRISAGVRGLLAVAGIAHFGLWVLGGMLGTNSYLLNAVTIASGVIFTGAVTLIWLDTVRYGVGWQLKPGSGDATSPAS